MSPESIQPKPLETEHSIDDLALESTLDSLRDAIINGSEEESNLAKEKLALINGHALAYMYHTLENGLDTSSQTEDAERATHALSALVAISGYIARYTDGRSEYSELRPEAMANIDENVQSALFAVLVGSGKMNYSPEIVTHIASSLEFQIAMAMELSQISLQQARLQGREPVISEQMQEHYNAIKNLEITQPSV